MSFTEFLNIAFLIGLALSSAVTSVVMYLMCPASLKFYARVPFLSRALAMFVIAMFYLALAMEFPVREYGRYIFRPALIAAEFGYQAEMWLVMWFVFGGSQRWYNILDKVKLHLAKLRGKEP